MTRRLWNGTRWLGLAMLVSGLLGCQEKVPVESGWLITVYYTAVEDFHRDTQSVDVTGCLVLHCSNGRDRIGSYPRGFVQAVKDEGTGRITSGEHAGSYLNWASSEGYWLDSAPRDHAGRPLVPFQSAAVDGLPDGTSIRVVDCGAGYQGSNPPQEVCDKLMASQWQIRDSFTPGYGGERHIDLYIGEENMADFTDASPFYASFENASLSIDAPRQGD